MTHRLSSRFDTEYWFALGLVLALALLLTVQVASMIVSFFQTDPTGPQSFQPAGFSLFLAGLLFSGSLLRTSREALRSPLPLATGAGLVFGIFLGSLSFLPYAFALQLGLGLCGPLLGLASTHPTPVAQAFIWPDFWLSILAVLLSFVLYALVAFRSTRRTGVVWLGWWAAILSAFVTLLAAVYTSSIVELLRSFPSPPEYLLSRISSIQEVLPLLALLLGPAQAIHAALAGYIGARLALRPRNRREQDRASP